MTITEAEEWHKARARVRQQVMSLEECHRCTRVAECRGVGCVKLPLTDPCEYETIWLCYQCDPED